MKVLFAVLAIAAVPSVSFAGQGDNILACIEAVKAYNGRSVDEFDALYEGNIINRSEVKWPDIVCSVKLGLVFDLTVDGNQLIVDQFSGADAKATYERLENQTDEAIALIESRVQILERRLEDARAKLQKPQPDIAAVAAHVESGIAKATGK
ncbi:hypothetical protein [Phaeobacter gallaeciensis]|uniref:hypothetical protein n=1 Tax=Phaeobacter gallaeciensis TaxID=60890 RepID=UPI00237F8DEA|nr:hypothetical protein [Phaeobacter gallaeciensis]MDE4063692.1 hypothetical protein [Phaeobacter gallaeciensis]MDE4126711.1 hypothetical protein [Phaeobacter gallaeciensis]MDE4131188.1 hypothetical protein [Phaeobacter gallaeciensis]